MLLRLVLGVDIQGQIHGNESRDSEEENNKSQMYDNDGTGE